MKQWQSELFDLYLEQRGRKGRDFKSAHPKFGKTRQEIRAAGLSVPTRDAPNFIATLLFNLDIFSEEEADAVIKATSSPARGESLLTALETHKDAIKQREDEISDAYEDEFSKYVNRAKINRGRGGSTSTGRKDKYEAQAAAIQMAKDQKNLLKQMKSKGIDAANSIEDAILSSMEGSKDETLVSIKIKNLTDDQKLVKTINAIGVDSDNIGVERVDQGIVVDFFIPAGSPVAAEFENLSPEDLDSMFSAFSSSGEATVEVLPPDEIGDAISSLKSNLEQPEKAKDPKPEEITDPDASPDEPIDYDPTSSGEVPTIDIPKDDDEDYEPTEDDYEDVGVSYDPAYDKRDDDYSDEYSDDEGEYDPMNPYGEDRWEDEEDDVIGYEGNEHHELARQDSREPFEDMRYTEDDGEDVVFDNIDGDDCEINIRRRFTGDEWMATCKSTSTGVQGFYISKDRDEAVEKAISEYKYLSRLPEDSPHLGGEDNQMMGYYEGNEDEARVQRAKDDVNNDEDIKRCSACGCNIDSPDPDCNCDKDCNSEENNEDLKMSPQQIDQWMAQQRIARMQNNMRHDERWN